MRPLHLVPVLRWKIIRTVVPPGWKESVRCVGEAVWSVVDDVFAGVAMGSLSMFGIEVGIGVEAEVDGGVNAKVEPFGKVIGRLGCGETRGLYQAAAELVFDLTWVHPRLVLVRCVSCHSLFRTLALDGLQGSVSWDCHYERVGYCGLFRYRKSSS